jgi:uncharacterized repeat protein (TIGR03803 family)
VFKVTPKGKETVRYSFTGGADGFAPYFVTLVFGKKGVLYGTTVGGGAYGDGTVFQVTPSGIETVLYSFAGSQYLDGASPFAGVLLETNTGTLYGTTAKGGAYGYGTVFEVTP